MGPVNKSMVFYYINIKFIKFKNESPYQGGIFSVEIDFGQNDYPKNPPKVKSEYQTTHFINQYLGYISQKLIPSKYS